MVRIIIHHHKLLVNTFAKFYCIIFIYNTTREDFKVPNAKCKIQKYCEAILPKSPVREFREGDRVSGGGSNKILYLTYPP